MNKKKKQKEAKRLCTTQKYDPLFLCLNFATMSHVLSFAHQLFIFFFFFFFVKSNFKYLWRVSVKELCRWKEVQTRHQSLLSREFLIWLKFHWRSLHIKKFKVACAIFPQTRMGVFITWASGCSPEMRNRQRSRVQQLLHMRYAIAI